MLSDKMLKQKPAIFFEFTVIWLISVTLLHTGLHCDMSKQADLSHVLVIL